mgnify:CR=1 FL=1
MFITENPTAIIFNFKYDNASFCRNGYIYLRVFSIRFLAKQSYYKKVKCGRIW